MSLTITEESIQIDEKLLTLTQDEKEKCTIVHCSYHATDEYFVGVRIWPSTFLVQDDGRRCKLIKEFNITRAPQWTYYYSPDARFTLVFEGLSKDCKSFYLQEYIAEEGSFYTDEIPRNNTDVYRVNVFTSE